MKQKHLIDDIFNYIFLKTQQTAYIEPLLVQCWATVYDAGPTLNHVFLTNFNEFMISGLFTKFRTREICIFFSRGVAGSSGPYGGR